MNALVHSQFLSQFSPYIQHRTAANDFEFGQGDRLQRPEAAESSGLAPASVDLATAGQAFHWFDPTRTRVELQRILRGRGGVALVWNVRRRTPFNDDYEELLLRVGAARRRKSFAAANHPFVDRCAFLLDSSFLEKARMAASRALSDIDDLAEHAFAATQQIAKRAGN